MLTWVLGFTIVISISSSLYFVVMIRTPVGTSSNVTIMKSPPTSVNTSTGGIGIVDSRRPDMPEL